MSSSFRVRRQSFGGFDRAGNTADAWHIEQGLNGPQCVDRFLCRDSHRDAKIVCRVEISRRDRTNGELPSNRFPVDR